METGKLLIFCIIGPHTRISSSSRSIPSLPYPFRNFEHKFMVFVPLSISYKFMGIKACTILFSQHSFLSFISVLLKSELIRQLLCSQVVFPKHPFDYLSLGVFALAHPAHNSFESSASLVHGLPSKDLLFSEL